METRSKWYTVTILVWIPILLLTIRYPIFIIYLVVGLFWYVAGKIFLPARFLTFYLKIEEKFPRLRKSGKPSEKITTTIGDVETKKTSYFFDKENCSSIPKRTIHVLLATLGLSLSASGVYIGLAKRPIDPVHAWVAPVVLALLVFLVLPFVAFPVWVYEDSGLRRYNRQSGMISVPGGPVKIFLPGVGIILGLFSFIIGQPSEEVLVFGLALLLFILPLALLGAVIFTYHVEPRLLVKFRNTRIVNEMRSVFS